MSKEPNKETVNPIPRQLPVNQETLDILVANIIPTSKYFEARFDHLEDRVERMQGDLTSLRSDMDKRFDDMKHDVNKRFDDMAGGVNKRFDDMTGDFNKQFDDMAGDVNKRFDDMAGDFNKQFDDMKDDVNKRFIQVDKRFEQMDKRFEQIITSLDKLTDKLDYRDERQRSFTIRMFTISITISILGVTGAFLKALAII